MPLHLGFRVKGVYIYNAALDPRDRYGGLVDAKFEC